MARSLAPSRSLSLPLNPSRSPRSSSPPLAPWGSESFWGSQWSWGWPKALKREGVRGSEGVGGSKLSKTPQSDQRLKVAKGFWRLPRLPEAPGRSQGPREAHRARGSEREWEGARGSERGWGEQGEQCPWVSLKTQGCRRLSKAPKAAWGSRKVPGAQEGSGAREQGGARGSEGSGSKGSNAPESDWRPKAFKG